MSVGRFCFLMFVIFPICEKLLKESHPDIACIARSKQHNGNPTSEVIGVLVHITLLVTGTSFDHKHLRM